MLAFTATANGVLREIVIDCGISTPFNPQDRSQAIPNVLNVKALWDTGATNCVITKSTADALKLQPISKAIIHHGGGQSIENVYLVNIYLPNKAAFQMIRVTECKETAGRFGLIVGMDIISMGDFAISNFQGKTTVSFRVPSSEIIDLSKINTNSSGQSQPTKKVGRNDPCPCGSGQKYKNCHGRGF